VASTNPTRVAVLLNKSSGPKREGASEEEIRSAFEPFGIHLDVIPLNDPQEASRQIAQRVKAGIHAIVAAGGDGTVSLVGAALAGTETSLGVLPTGTLNHFAKDMRLPTDLQAAAAAIANGRTVNVDVAEVNGRVFLNNSSLGFYPTIVIERDKRIAKGMSKMIALVPATLTAMWRFPNTTVRLQSEETGIITRTPFVFIGNNHYVFSGLQAGSRAHLCDGRLQLCAIASASRWTLVKSVFLALVGNIETAPEVITLDTRWAKIGTLRRYVRIALDGEVVRMKTPLVYSIRPAALKVLVPAEEP
jgi:YegS/Rv2252/BmrU family lipid kinase